MKLLTIAILGAAAIGAITGSPAIALGIGAASLAIRNSGIMPSTQTPPQNSLQNSRYEGVMMTASKASHWCPAPLPPSTPYMTPEQTEVYGKITSMREHDVSNSDLPVATQRASILLVSIARQIDMAKSVGLSQLGTFLEAELLNLIQDHNSDPLEVAVNKMLDGSCGKLYFYEHGQLKFHYSGKTTIVT